MSRLFVRTWCKNNNKHKTPKASLNPTNPSPTSCTVKYLYPCIGCKCPIWRSLSDFRDTPWSLPHFVLTLRCCAGLRCRLWAWRLLGSCRRFHRRRWSWRRGRDSPIYWRWRRRWRWRWRWRRRHLESVICCSLEARDSEPRSWVARKLRKMPVGN